ncbi:hypothetical protein AVEN_161077-1 [Araneus ventricosus]|uniref:Uncharacterized protein n=1 Tax=Araneus ventricosus TaxID=182803 RepID=A0A4Y2DX65_ARAVE|nr:hypothetical protein AVEN_161077-1 [Araneus ventricosus]
MQFLPSFRGLPKPSKILKSIAARLCTEELPCSNSPRVYAMAATSGETSVNDRKVKESGLDRDLSTVPAGSCNCICVLGWYSTTRCLGGRITTAINPQNMGLGYKAILFHCFRKAYYRERYLFFSPTLSGGPNCLLFKGPTCHRASWQPRQSATEY